jgi:hypothetical protein
MILEVLPPVVDVLVLFMPYGIYALFDYLRWQESREKGEFDRSYWSWFYRTDWDSTKKRMRESFLVFLFWVPWAAILIAPIGG